MQAMTKKKPSARQIEAYKYLYILDVGTHEDVAELMDCHRTNVTRLIGRLRKTNPELFTDHTGKTISFTSSHETGIIHKF